MKSGRREPRRPRQRLAHEVTGVEFLGNAMVLFQQRFAIYLGKLFDDELLQLFALGFAQLRTEPA